ncbi:ATP-dependent DNA helicase pif1-like [Octopus vulgaris]|uniref:ATP-dependent DNA helicase n=1 Tax=Octopus vulgaris TaxID=6645 RepID=A0AA36AQ29_OCTVU|nr:ATP-dependent DNA helicase pif1-like [Octopus vulgaris]
MEEERSNYRRSAKCLSQQLGRLRQTKEQKEDKLKRNVERQLQLRLAQSHERRKQILEQDAAQHRNARQLSQEQREQILEHNAIQHRRRQINNRLALNIARQYDIDGLLQVPVDVARHSCGLLEMRQHNFSHEAALDIALNDMLCELDHRMGQYDRSTIFFRLPAAIHDLRMNVLLHEDEKDPNAEEFFNANIHTLNNDQRIIFENIQQKIDRNEGGLIFIDARGGTGKTFLHNILLSYVCKNNQLAFASSGIAATL